MAVEAQFFGAWDEMTDAMLDQYTAGTYGGLTPWRTVVTGEKPFRLDWFTDDEREAWLQANWLPEPPERPQAL